MSMVSTRFWFSRERRALRDLFLEPRFVHLPVGAATWHRRPAHRPFVPRAFEAWIVLPCRCFQVVNLLLRSASSFLRSLCPSPASTDGARLFADARDRRDRKRHGARPRRDTTRQHQCRASGGYRKSQVDCERGSGGRGSTSASSSRLMLKNREALRRIFELNERKSPLEGSTRWPKR